MAESSAIRSRPSEALRIDVWHWPLYVADQDLQSFTELLSDDERMRMQRIVHERDRRAFAVARGQLRLLLAAQLGIEARSIEFAYGVNGKPLLETAESVRPLHFNLSHSGGRAVAAISRHCVLGVDIEAMAPVDRDVADHFFSVHERRSLSRVGENQWQRAFFECWTRKEAFVKALGTGLDTDLTSFDVSLGPGEAPRLLRIGSIPEAASEWWLAELALPSSFVGAVAANSGAAEVTLVEHGQPAANVTGEAYSRSSCSRPIHH